MSCFTTGPFRQTIFLGSSVQKYDMNLAWGAEQSTCSVTLVDDYAFPIMGSSKASHRTRIQSLNDQSQISNAFNTSNLSTPPNDHTLNKGIIKNLHNKYTDLGSGTNLKKCIHAHSGDVLDFSGPDPGFLPTVYGVDIIGSAVNFRYENINFAGIVKNWKTSPNGVHTVEIQSLVSILKNTRMILQKYRGGVAARVSSGGNSYTIPYLNTNFTGIDGNIANGNTANIINVFGWLENRGLGNSGWSRDRGIPAASIYDALTTILGSNDKTIFGPYGALVGRSPYTKSGNYNINTQASWIRYSGTTPASQRQIYYHHLGLLHTKIATDNIYRSIIKLDISNLPRPPSGIYINDDTMDILTFIDFICENSGVDYTVQFSPDSVGSAYTGTLSVKTVDRRKQNQTNYIENLINNIIDEGGQEKIVDYSYGEEYSESNTKSILVGGRQKRLHQFSTHNYSAYRHWRIFEPSIGTAIGSGPNFANITLENSRNRYREPDIATQRTFAWNIKNGALVGQANDTFSNADPNRYYIFPGTGPVLAPGQTSSGPVYGATITKGSYLNMIQPVSAADVAQGGGYNITNDVIAPYFGIDSNGNVRNAYYKTGGRQMVVSVPASDLQPFFGASISGGNYDISENEIRAALGGDYKNWLVYHSARMKLGDAADIGNLIYDYLSAQYGSFQAKHAFALDMSVAQRKFQAMLALMGTDYGNPLNTDAPNVGTFYFYDSGLLDIVRGIHKYIVEEIGSHYGKHFMVRLPGLVSYTDGAGQHIYRHEITDSAWEEDGNSIDDTLKVGDSLLNMFTNDDGTIGPMLAFDNSNEKYRRPSVQASTILGRTYFKAFVGGAHITEYYPLKTASPYVYVNYNIDNILANRKTSFGDAMTQGYKWYLKATPLQVNQYEAQNQSVIWHNGSPRVVMATQSPVTIGGDTDISNVVNECLSRLGTSTYAGTIWEYLLGNHMVATSQEFYMADRAALPVYAAVPIQDNFATYGPWSTNPGLIADEIFDSNGTAQVNNLVGGGKVEIDDTLVPWEYGSTANMDTAAMTKLNSMDKYEQVLEYGSITVADILLGDLDTVGSQYNAGPYLTAINTSSGPDGIRTTYTFRTFSRKLGFYNKEITDNIRAATKQQIELNRKFRSQIRGY